MIPARAFDLPPEKERELRQARRLEKWTLIYLITSAAFLGVTMGGSQAMRTSFYEDVISAVPAIMFLVCTRIARRAPNRARLAKGFWWAVVPDGIRLGTKPVRVTAPLVQTARSDPACP
jgi:hypothetical protein